MRTVQLEGGSSHEVDTDQGRVSLTECYFTRSFKVENTYVFDFPAGQVRINGTRREAGTDTIKVPERVEEVSKYVVPRGEEETMPSNKSRYEKELKNLSYAMPKKKKRPEGGYYSVETSRDPDRIRPDGWRETKRPPSLEGTARTKEGRPGAPWSNGPTLEVDRGGDHSSLSSGTRVRISRDVYTPRSENDAGGESVGTIVEWSKGARATNSLAATHVLVLLDTPDKRLEDSEMMGKHRKLVVKRQEISFLREGLNPSDYAFYAGVPKGVGIILQNGLDSPNIFIPEMNVGRVVKAKKERLGEYLVNLPQARAEGYDSQTKAVSGIRGEDYPSCYWLKKTRFCWGRYDPETFEVLSLFPNDVGWDGRTELKAGDIVQYSSSKVHKFSSEGTRRNQGLNWAVPRGALLEVKATGNDGGMGSVRCSVISGSSPEILGYEVILPRSSVSLVKEEIVVAGKTVEIIAEISYNGHPLKGRKATVVLARDGDDEVGIELEIDINAGSLDGHGRSGHCLYISEGALRKTE